MEQVEPPPLQDEGGKVRNRRAAPVAGGSGEGRPSDQLAAAQSRLRLLNLPLTLSFVGHTFRLEVELPITDRSRPTACVNNVMPLATRTFRYAVDMIE
jgi:hypothetical protein